MDEKRYVPPHVMAEIRRFIEALGPDMNKHDKADTAIAVCLENGLVFGSSICWALGEMGFNKQHVGIRLTKGAGSDPKQHLWRQNGDEGYVLN